MIGFLFHEFEGLVREHRVRRLDFFVTVRIPNLKPVEQADQHRLVRNARLAREEEERALLLKQKSAAQSSGMDDPKRAAIQAALARAQARQAGKKP